MGDGSNDLSLREQEAVVIRYLGPNGLPVDECFYLAELDLSTSEDGRSPDAKCIAHCYSHSFGQLESSQPKVKLLANHGTEEEEADEEQEKGLL
eukprot:6291873-Prymnesium_polylepis.2